MPDKRLISLVEQFKHFRAALEEVGVKADKVEKVMKLLEGRRGAVLNR
jgi:hypothetical protein